MANAMTSGFAATARSFEGVTLSNIAAFSSNGASAFLHGSIFRLTGYKVVEVKGQRGSSNHLVFEVERNDGLKADLYITMMMRPHFGADGTEPVTPDGSCDKAFQAYVAENAKADMDAEAFMKGFFEAHKDEKIRVVRKAIRYYADRKPSSYVTLDFVK